jgi:hypothetical protein
MTEIGLKLQDTGCVDRLTSTYRTTTTGDQVLRLVGYWGWSVRQGRRTYLPQWGRALLDSPLIITYQKTEYFHVTTSRHGLNVWEERLIINSDLNWTPDREVLNVRLECHWLTTAPQ